MNKADRPDAEGFTLLEVIIAFAILALSWSVIAGVFSDGLRATERYETERTALQLAQSTLNGLETQMPLRVSETQGRFDNGFRWHVVVRARKSRASVWFRAR